MSQTLTPDTMLYTHAGIRLSPPDSRRHDGLWLVHLLTANLAVKVTPEVAFLLVGFMRGQTTERVLGDVSRCRIGDPESAIRAIGWLRDTGFLVDASETTHCWAEQILKDWSRYEWHATSEYHISTFDFPFLDYSQPGSVEFDAHLMDRYERAEPDTMRTKRYPGVHESYAAPATKHVLDAWHHPFGSAWHRFCSQVVDCSFASERVMGTHLLEILSVTFGRLRSRTVLRDGVKRELLRKTSPSGGARHPTEAYVAVIDVDGVTPGMYHFCVETNSLDRIADLPDMRSVEVLFEGPFRSRQEMATEPSAVVVMTSVFERVMWRYREPRTFRTLFMDVGHLTATLQFASSMYGYSCYTQHGLVDEEIERLIGVDKLSEGVVYGAAIGVPGSFATHQSLEGQK